MINDTYLVTVYCAVECLESERMELVWLTLLIQIWEEQGALSPSLVL